MRDLLILGGLGYIGTSLLDQLDFDDFDNLIIVDLDLFKTKNVLLNSIDQEKKNKLKIYNFNFVNENKLEAVFTQFNIDIIVHLGGLVGDPACAYNEDLTKKINITATNIITDLAIKFKVPKIIFSSSCSVYGINNKICNEITTPEPISLYAASKLDGEKKLELEKNKFSEITIFRFSTIYGVSQRVRFDLVANLFYAKARWENKITLFGGWQWRPFIHVTDAALSIKLAIKKNTKGLNIYNVGLKNGNSDLLNLANLTKKNFPESEIVELGSGSDARNYQVSFEKFKDHFGDVLKFDLENGVNKLFNDLQDFNKNWKNDVYSNFLITKKNEMLLKNE